MASVKPISKYVRAIVDGENVLTPEDAAGLQLDTEAAQMIVMLAALGQHTRFRLVAELLASDSERMSVNALADAVGILQNSASAHLAIWRERG